MRKLIFSLISIASCMLLCGCAANYTMVLIPRTPENLQAFRDCQRTAAVATGYDQQGFQDLKSRCLSTLEGTKTETVEKMEAPTPPPGCTEADTAGSTYYYLCK